MHTFCQKGICSYDFLILGHTLMQCLIDVQEDHCLFKKYWSEHISTESLYFWIVEPKISVLYNVC